MPRLERESDRRFWEIHLEADEKTLHTRAGFLGSDGRASSKKTWPSKKAAAAELKERLAEQKGKGYVQLPEWDEPATPELLAAIGANPTDPGGYLVYADWLQQKRHPRGELIVLQSLLGSARTDKKQLAAEAALLAKHPKLVPPRCAEASKRSRRKQPPLSTSELRWENGFIAGARLAHFFADQPWTIRELVAELLSHPAGRFLRALELGVRGDTKEVVSYRDALGDLARLAPPSLRSLSVVEAPRDSAALAFADLGPLDEVLAAMPALESLRLAGTKMSFGEREMPGLKHVVVLMTEPSALTSLVAGRFPALTSLELEAGGAPLDLKAVEQLFTGGRTPSLTRLALRGTANTDAVVERLCASALAAQLEGLDLTGGALSSAGAARVVDHASSFPRLASLGLEDNLIARAPPRLASLVAKVALGSQRKGAAAALSQADLAGLASDSQAFSKAKALATKSAWLQLSRSGSTCSGVCDGSEPWETTFDLTSREGTCTCVAMVYARTGYCKHIVALAMLAASGKV